MFERKECKRKAKQSLQRHYLLFVFLCLVAAMIGTSYISSYSTLTDTVKTITAGGDESVVNVNSKWQLTEALAGALENNLKDSKDVSEELVNQEKDQKSLFLGKHVEVGYYKGVLAKARNELMSGAFIITAVSALTVVVGSSSVAVAILVILAFMIAFCVWVFIINVYSVVYARMFMEGRTYEKVPMQHFAYLLYVRKWGRASVTMLLKSFYYNLWTLTIIGGVIKYFSYFAVPYIVAENPAIGSKNAINLSRSMMNGHKWECFKFHLTFIGWKLLEIITAGISGILYSNPYLESARCEYYVYIRESAIENGLEGTEALNDTYLYKLPSDEKLAEYYDTSMTEDSEVGFEEKKKAKSIFAWICDFLGIYFSKSNYEEEKNLLKKKNDYRRVKYVLNKQEYPYKLSPFPEKQRRNVLQFLYYNRKYSIWTLFLFFVFFSCIGWMWEVSLHLINDGQFVNRGTLQGPWLPIYGTGGIIILLFLNKLRDNPVVEFFSAIVLCGLVEYGSGYMLETMHNGEKWWNYTGYFLNIDGRVCAEGLLVFGLGGMIVVYLVAPLFDNFIRKLPHKVVVTVALALFVALNADIAYSSVHPNTGEGISSGYNDSYNDRYNDRYIVSADSEQSSLPKLINERSGKKNCY